MEADLLLFKETPSQDFPSESPVAFFLTVAQALRENSGVRIQYCSASGEISERTIFPEVIFCTGGEWYTAAWCDLRQEPRTFKLKNISSAELSSDKAPPNEIAQDYRQNGIPWQQALSPQVTVPENAFSPPPPPVHAAEKEKSLPDHPLIRSIRQNDIEAVRQELKKGEDLNSFHGISPLKAAIGERSLPLVKLLLEHGADPLHPNWQPNHLQDIPLVYAADRGWIEGVKLLLEQTPPGSINILDRHGTPLSEAIFCGQILLAHELLHWGADPNIMPPGGPPVLSRIFDTLRVIPSWLIETTARLCLECGARIDQADAHGRTPLFAAISSGDLRLVKLFLEHNADIKIQDRYGRTPLAHALYHFNCEDGVSGRPEGFGHHNSRAAGLPELIKLLLEHGADPSIPDKEGIPPVRLAHGPILELLLQYGADVSHIDEYGNSEAHYHAADLRDLLLLEKYGVDMKAVNHAGQNLLFWTVIDHRHLSFLIGRYGFSVNSADSEGMTILYRAVQEKNTEAIRFLVEQGAALNMCPSQEYNPWELLKNRFEAYDNTEEMHHLAEFIHSVRLQYSLQLAAACRKGDPAEARRWLQMGASVTSPADPDGSMMTELAAAWLENPQFAPEQIKELCLLLLEAGDCFFSIDSKGNCLPAVMLLYGQRELFEEFLAPFENDLLIYSITVDRYIEFFKLRFPAQKPPRGLYLLSAALLEA